MKIQYCSDLHLEFKENKTFLDKHPIQPMGEILLLAGDVIPFALIGKHNDFFDFVSANYESVFWVPGNHEYYHCDLGDVKNPLYEKIRKNVFLVNNQILPYKSVNLIFSTLWSAISPQNEWDVQQNGMSYSLPSKDVIADSIEAIAGAHYYDSLVTVVGCDKNMPGALIAMRRLNRPSILVDG